METLYDGIIVGGGPAGWSAAIYLARAQYRTLVIERSAVGGQIAITADVVNYPGILRTDGTTLMETMRQQAMQFGAECLTATVTALSMQAPIKEVQTEQGTFRAHGLLLATGASPRMAGFRGETEFRGRGVAYCATCDGEFFTGQEVFVIGGGFAAAQEALFLTKYAKHITVCVRSDAFSCAKTIAEQVLAHPKIQVLFQTKLIEASGDTMLRHVVLQHTVSGEKMHMQAEGDDFFGIFVFAGYQPETALFADAVALTPNGYLQTDRQQKTSIEGVYGAGDVCEKELRQVVTAAADGAIAAVSLERYVEQQRAKQHLPSSSGKRSAVPEPADKEAEAAGFDASYFPPDLQNQLKTIFAPFSKDLLLRVDTDGSRVAEELLSFTRSLCALSAHLQWEQVSCSEDPKLSICTADGSPIGWSFHGVPGGHECNSLVALLRDAAGLGQPPSPALQKKLAAHPGCRIAIAVTLSCSMCPETVFAAGQLARYHPAIQVDVYDVRLYPELRQKHQIMSVPCILINDQVVAFGKKNLEALCDLLP